jgi:cytochrome c biogenesis protein CcdA
MHLTDYSLALVSGVFVLFSPCSYPLLPGYVAYYLGSKMSSERALQGGLACGTGLVAVFSAIGLATYALGSALLKLLPFAHQLAAVVIGLLGATMILGVGIPRFYFNIHATQRGGLLGLFLYGVTYAVASLACSTPIFMSIMLYALTFGDFLDGVLTFVTFSLGMCIPLLLTTVLVARASGLVLKKITGATSKIQRASGLVLIVLAVYLYFLP